MIKTACIGDSITWGFTILRRRKNTYPAQLQELLGHDWKVRNFGVNNACANFSGDLPYGRLPALHKALRFKPDVVVMMLGTNDSKRVNWNPEAFVSGYSRIVDSFLGLKRVPKVFLLLPPHIYGEYGPEMFALNEDRLAGEIIPAIREIAQERNLPLIDIHSVIADKSLLNDGIHPGRTGAGMIAWTVASALLEQ